MTKTIKEFKKLKKLADNGDAESQYELGGIYEQEEIEANKKAGVFDETYAKALKWFRKAADNGHGNAIEYMAFYYYLRRKDKEKNAHSQEGLKWYLKAAKSNNKGMSAYWNYILAHIYKEGCCEGVEVNLPEARKYYQLLYDNDMGSAYSLGNCYYDEGKYDEAYKLFKKSVDANEADAYNSLYKLSHMYENGLGVNVDLKAALSCYKMAAEVEMKELMYNDD